MIDQLRLDLEKTVATTAGKCDSKVVGTETTGATTTTLTSATLATTLGASRTLQGEIESLTRQVREKRHEIDRLNEVVAELENEKAKLEVERNELANELQDTKVV